MVRQIKFRGKVRKGYNEDFFKQQFVYGSAIICEGDTTSTIINDKFEAEVETNTIGQRFRALRSVLCAGLVGGKTDAKTVLYEGGISRTTL